MSGDYNSITQNDGGGNRLSCVMQDEPWSGNPACWELPIREQGTAGPEQDAGLFWRPATGSASTGSAGDVYAFVQQTLRQQRKKYAARSEPGLVRRYAPWLRVRGHRGRVTLRLLLRLQRVSLARLAASRQSLITPVAGRKETAGDLTRGSTM